MARCSTGAVYAGVVRERADSLHRAMILFVSYSGVLGGAERVLVDVASADHDERWLACPLGPLAQAAAARGVRVLPLRSHSLRLRGDAAEAALAISRLADHGREARTLIRDLEPEAVVAWGMRSAIAVVGAGGHATPIVFAHNDMLPGPAIGRLVRGVARRCDQVVAASEAVAGDLDPGGRLRGRLAVVHPGVDVDSYADGSDAVPSPKAPEVVVLGALVEWKRPDLALEACALARRRHPDLRLLFVGAPLDGERSLVDRLHARASQPDLAGAVEFAGAVADPRPILSRARCLLHCAPREPFGLAVLEALGAACPAVVPAAAGPAEIVDASCGWLYTPGDPESAAEALLEVLADPARAARMGARGRARARERFDRRTTVRRWNAALASVAPREPGSLVRGGARSEPAASRAIEGLALVTVSHNSAAELRTLLRSVQRYLPGAQVVVVDCASGDDSVAVARAQPAAVSVALPENIGFGRACNAGMAEVRAEITALVNPDVELLDDSLLLLAAQARRRDAPDRLLAPVVVLPDGSRQDSVHPVPGSWPELARALIPPALLPGRAGAALAPWRARSPRRVGWAVGCAVVARTETLLRLGPFDERIFMYGEDLELGLRAARGGVQTWFWPAARVLHARAHATAAAFGGEPFELLARTRHEAVARQLGTRRAALDDAAQATTFASRAVLKRLLGRSSERERRQLRALVHARSSSSVITASVSSAVRSHE